MPLSRELIRLKILLQTWMILFLGATVVFLFFGRYLLLNINNLSAKMFPSLPLLPQPQEQFWLTLTISLMITLVYLCYWGQKEITKNYFVVVPILISKFTSTFFFFVFLITDVSALAYFVGLVVDGTIFLITWFFYNQAKRTEKIS